MSGLADDQLDDITPYYSDDEDLARRGAVSAGGTPVIDPPKIGPPTHPTTSPGASLPPVTVATKTPTPQSATSSGIDAQTAADEKELGRVQSTGSGISQIQHSSPEGGIGIKKAHPILGGALRAAETLGSVVAPWAMVEVPGTSLHHQAELGRSRGALNQDVEEQEREAQAGLQTAQAGEAPSIIGRNQADERKSNAEADAAGKPKPKEEKWDAFTGWTDKDGTPLIREENSGQVVRANDKKAPTGFQAAEKADKQDPTSKVTRVINGVPHEVLINSRTGEDIKDEGQTKVPGESPQDKRNASESAQVEREARQSIRKAETTYRATQQSVGQLATAIDGAKDGNGLLTSFVPTMEVLGINASNGVHRISPAEAQAASLPGGWAERFNAWFDKSTSGKLSPQLQEEGKALGKILSDSAYQKYKSTYDDENGIVAGYGGTDFGKRVPAIPGENQPAAGGGAGGEPQPPKAPDAGMKWQHRTVNGKTEWRQVKAQ